MLSGATIDISGAYVTLDKTKYVYGKTKYYPAVSVSVNYVNLSADDYSVDYKNNKFVGTATVTVSGKGAYSGSKTLSFTIVPKGTGLAKLTAAKKAITVKWKKQTTQTTGYQLQLSTSKKFKKAKTITVKKNKTTSRKVTKLKAKKKYFVRIRTFKTVNGKRYYSDWSKVKTVKTK
ncbi:MAG: fibronectin type III domain-containing protein [Eubacterium sp.]|nr:fibronectin type III domain-containing protein [Eubacterium sp.]